MNTKPAKPDPNGQPTMVRLREPLANQIDRWIERQNEFLSRPEALRRLAKLGLAVSEALTKESK